MSVEVQAFAAVEWATIETEMEAGGFREAIAAVFKKYEGTPLVDAEGVPLMGGRRQLLVSQVSFGKRFGIPRTTLLRWVELSNMDGSPGGNGGGKGKPHGSAPTPLKKLLRGMLLISEALADPALDLSLGEDEGLDVPSSMIETARLLHANAQLGDGA